MLLGGAGGACFSTYGCIKNLLLDYMLPKILVLVRRTAFIIGDMRSPIIRTFRTFFSLFGQFLCE